MKSDYNLSQDLIDKYRFDELNSKARDVSSEYAAIQGDMQAISYYTMLIENYDNEDYKGNTYFRNWSKQQLEEDLITAKQNLYGSKGYYEEYAQAHSDQSEEQLHQSLEYARYMYNQTNITKYQAYADGNVPNFRSIAYAADYNEENGADYWFNKAIEVYDYIFGIVGSKETYETLRDSGTATEEEIAAAKAIYDADVALLEKYNSYQQNYYNNDFVDYEYTSDKGYVSFRQEGMNEARYINDYNTRNRLKF